MKRTNLNLASRSFRPVADAVLITALCYLTLILAEVKSPLLAWLTNSDQLTIPSFVIDLERSLSNYVGWNLPRAPFFFPDVILYALSGLLFDDFRVRILFSILAQMTAAIYIFGYAAALLSNQSRTACRYAVLALIASLSLIANSIDSAIFFSTLMWFYSPFMHFIYFALGLFCIIFTLEYPRNKGVHGIVFAVITFSVFSDQIFLIDYNIPTIALLFFLGFFQKNLGADKKNFARESLWFVFSRDTAAAILGLILAALQTRQVMPDKAHSLPSLLENLRRIYDTVPLTNAAGLLALWLPLLVSLVFMGTAVQRFRRTRKISVRGMLLFFMAVLAAINLVTTTPIFVAANCYRYLIGLVFVPLIISVAALLRSASSGKNTYACLWPLLAAIPLFFFGMYWGALKQNHFVSSIVTWQLPMAKDLMGCTERYGLKAGLADYWTSRRLIMSSNWQLHVNQVNPDKSRPFHWGSNLNWFTEDFFNPAEPLTYNYIIFTDKNSAAMVRDYGAPETIVVCGDASLALYPSDRLTKAVSDYLPSSVIAGWQHSPHKQMTVTLPAKLFSSQIGQLDHGLWRTNAATDAKGFLIFGPYITLPAGQYVFEIEYNLRQKGAPVTWDIASDAGKDIHGSMVLPATPEPTKGFTVAELKVTLPRSTPLLETRVFSDSVNELAIKRVTINRQ